MIILYCGLVFHRSYLRVLGGQCCCSSQCSNSGCWAGPLRCGSKRVVQGVQVCPVWCRYECAAPGHEWRKWRPCRLHRSHTGSQSSHTGQWCSYTTELQTKKGQKNQHGCNYNNNTEFWSVSSVNECIQRVQTYCHMTSSQCTHQLLQTKADNMLLDLNLFLLWTSFSLE